MIGEMIGFRTFFGNFKMGKSLIKSIENLDVDAVENALAQQPSLAQFQSWITGTPLQAAAKHGNLDIVHALIQAGKCDANQRIRRRRGKANEDVISDQAHRRVSEFVNVQCTHSGKTALMYACEEGHADVINYLLSHGADALLTDRLKQSTALHYCVQNKHLKAAEVLLRFVEALLDEEQLKEYINRKNTEGYSALSLAARCDCELTELIVRYQPDLYVRTEVQDMSTGVRLSAQSTVFHLAAASGDLGTVSCLLREFFRHYHEVQYLENAPDLRMFSNVGQELPYQVARRASYREVARLLKPWVALESLQKKVSRVNSLRHIARCLLRSKLIGELDQIETEEKDIVDKDKLTDPVRSDSNNQVESEIELGTSTPRKTHACDFLPPSAERQKPIEILEIINQPTPKPLSIADLNVEPIFSLQGSSNLVNLEIVILNEKSLEINLFCAPEKSIEDDSERTLCSVNLNGVQSEGQGQAVCLEEIQSQKLQQNVCLPCQGQGQGICLGKLDESEEEGEEEECVICMESNVTVAITGCGHRFCIPCTRELLNKQVKGQKLIPCPICRRPIGGFKSLK